MRCLAAGTQAHTHAEVPTHSGEILCTALPSPILAVQKHLVYVVAGALHKLQHVEGLAGKELALLHRLPQSGHEVIKVGLLHPEQPGHPEQVVPPHLGLAEAVVVADGDGREVHDWAVHLVQDGDVRILVVLDDGACHLVQKYGKRGEECGSPEQPADGHTARQEDVTEAMEGAVGPKNGDV